MINQNAVEWLINELKLNDTIEKENLIIARQIIEQANEMQRKQRFQDFKEGFQAAFDSLQAANNLVQNKKYGGDK
jgi:hypothetical protein